MADKTSYWGPDGNLQIGYIKDGKTYTNEEGTQRIAVGSTVPGGDGSTFYTLGADGNGYLNTNFKVPTGTGGAGGTLPPQAAAAADDYIKRIYDAKIKAATEALTSAYNQNVLGLQAAKDAIPDTYNTARNSVAAQNAIQTSNFNQYAADSGLNTGAGGQARLAMSGALQSNLGGLDKQQAKDLSAADLQMSQLKAKFNGDIAAAIAEGNFQQATALYDQYVKNQAADRADKQFQAQLEASKENANYIRSRDYADLTGDFSSMSTWYRPQAIYNAVSNHAMRQRMQGMTGDNIINYLTDVVRSGAISQDQAEQIMRSLGLTRADV